MEPVRIDYPRISCDWPRLSGAREVLEAPAGL